jgi:glycosyltransferase involved in cell wall biosynthesis
MTSAESSKLLPAVSVIMPCYNAGRFLASAIQSVLDQDYPGSLEVVVVDDGSTDDSALVASRFEGVVVLRQSNEGPGAARNLGLAHAQGELIAFLDADDVWMPGCLLPRVQCLMQNPDVALVFGDFTRWAPSSPELGADSEYPDRLPACVADAVTSGWLFPEILLDPIVHIITVIARREVFNAIGAFDTLLRTGEDYDLWIRASRRFRFQKIDRFVARYRQHSEGTTKIPRAENNEYKVAIRAMEAFGLLGQRGIPLNRELMKARLHKMCFDHAYLHFWHGDAGIASIGFRRAIQHNRRRVKAWVYMLLATCKSWIYPSSRLDVERRMTKISSDARGR